jgi:hypothetical protein
VKRKIRKDGAFVRPTSSFVDLWTPSWEKGLPWTEEETRDKDGNVLTEEQLWAKFGREGEWQDGVENVVVRPPLVEVFKDRTSVEAVIFIHRRVCRKENAPLLYACTPCTQQSIFHLLHHPCTLPPPTLLPPPLQSNTRLDERPAR